MKKFIFVLVIFSFYLKTLAQDNSKINYDGLLKLEDMEYVGGITFCIEPKNQTLIAVQNDTIKWKADVVIECGKRKAKITSVMIRSGKLKISFGKNKNALVNIMNGEIECLVEEKRKRIKQKSSVL